eukprot:CAMPEP_0176003110 /NCGR_PEP_ID=MMETSP0120_2-20121206/1001_1 /TAXON_ID=160619 /ORGANISM="Kryptoperidinium foliaceum, Strain CCMP 1326" /LENGTH=69 /DNA_ID=CAMNT_0017335735 /DNA_START=241 /DNA_END=447 /DNA_ORIENTATION=-
MQADSPTCCVEEDLRGLAALTIAWVFPRRPDKIDTDARARHVVAAVAAPLPDAVAHWADVVLVEVHAHG